MSATTLDAEEFCDICRERSTEVYLEYAGRERASLCALDLGKFILLCLTNGECWTVQCKIGGADNRPTYIVTRGVAPR